jgi:hypothetical protein
VRWDGWPWQHDRAKDAGETLGEPLFFHHVAKTGGTSLIQAFCEITPRALQSARHGTLTAEFAQGLVARGLRHGEFIYGHPGSGAALVLRGCTQMITLLRDPCDQAISNFYSLRNDPRLPDSRAAWRLGFREFLLRYPYYAIFQTASLHLGIEERPLSGTSELIDRLPVIFDYLDEMHAVGTPTLAAEMFRRIAAERGVNNARRYPHRFRTRLFPSRRAVMREQYEALQDHPELRPLLAAERALYEKAQSLAKTSGLGANVVRPALGPSGQ